MCYGKKWLLLAISTSQGTWSHQRQLPTRWHHLPRKSSPHELIAACCFAVCLVFWGWSFIKGNILFWIVILLCVFGLLFGVAFSLGFWVVICCFWVAVCFGCCNVCCIAGWVGLIFDWFVFGWFSFVCWLIGSFARSFVRSLVGWAGRLSWLFCSCRKASLLVLFWGNRVVLRLVQLASLSFFRIGFRVMFVFESCGWLKVDFYRFACGVLRVTVTWRF